MQFTEPTCIKSVIHNSTQQQKISLIMKIVLTLSALECLEKSYSKLSNYDLQ